ncbi:MAG: hypothetical protein K8T20_11210 [Planctomycetes bacterium]|nr:hypothetical protein [Planctomycetota bacterium]
MEKKPGKSTRCEVCRRREAGNTWSRFVGDAMVRERRICDVCIRVRAALSKSKACANCGKKSARRFNLRFSPGGMSLAVFMCRQCWAKQAVVDRIHRKIKGVVKKRGNSDENGIHRDIERFLRRQDGDLN